MHFLMFFFELTVILHSKFSPSYNGLLILKYSSKSMCSIRLLFVLENRLRNNSLEISLALAHFKRFSMSGYSLVSG